jgi:glutathione S-transferase
MNARTQSMSLKLYYHPLSSFCHKALIALYEGQTPFEPVFVDLSDEKSSAGLRSLWPIAKFPVLRDEARNCTVAESTVIIEYLDTYYPGPTRLVPVDPDLAWQTRMRDRFYDLYVHLPLQKIVGDRLRPAGASDPFGVEEARATLRRVYGIIDQEMAGRTWAAGENFSLADCAASPALFYANTVEPIGPERKNLQSYFGRLMSRPSYARATEEAQPYFDMFPMETKPQVYKEKQ